MCCAYDFSKMFAMFAMTAWVAGISWWCLKLSARKHSRCRVLKVRREYVGAPKWICLGHIFDKLSRFRFKRRSSGSCFSGFESPKQFETLFVPTDHGVRLDKDQDVPPTFPSSWQKHPKNSIPSPDIRSSYWILIYRKLLAKSKILKNQIWLFLEQSK